MVETRGEVNQDFSLASVIENLIFIAGEPLSTKQLADVLADFPGFSEDALQAELENLHHKYDAAAIELKHLPGGYVFQTRAEYAPWVQKLFTEKPRKYSQAFLEVLAIIAYDQPVTRAEIEHKRGVAISPQMIKTLLEREWIKVVGYKDAPGKPALYATTTQFLNYFNLASLDDLPKMKAE
jgi:segregation and condensation protein B